MVSGRMEVSGVSVQVSGKKKGTSETFIGF